jgi:cyclopropane fatty-acyl-phospholipid synthase-like methyltransferase
MPTPTSETVLPNHLGGHQQRTHNDYGALRYFITRHRVTSFLDIGCGPGGMVDLAAGLGLQTLGVDGDFTLPQFAETRRDTLRGNYLLHDFTVGPLPTTIVEQPVDLVWSVEFLEHIEEQYLPAVMQVFRRGRRILVTAAPPGAPGHHHVNCQSAEYWIELFRSYGLFIDDAATEIVRRESTMIRNFIRETGLVFVNQELLHGTY